MTKQQYELNCEILQSLDKIDSCVMESETLVMDSMLNAYSKAVTVLEHCSDTADLSSFNIIQESFILEDGETGETGNDTKQQKLIIKILMFIPKLIMKAVNFIKGKLSGLNTTKKLLQRIDELEKMSSADREAMKDTLDRYIRSNNDRNYKNEKDINQLTQRRLYDKSDAKLRMDTIEADIASLERGRQNTQEQLKEVTDKVNKEISSRIDNVDTINANIASLADKRQIKEVADKVNKEISSRIGSVDKIKDIIDVMNGNIRTYLDFDRIENMYSEILSSFKIIEKFDMHKPSTMASDMRKKISNDKLIGTVENSAGSSVINNIDIFVAKGKSSDIMKLSTFKEKLQKVAEIRCDIEILGRKITNKLQSQVKEYGKHIIEKKGKLNGQQHTKVEDVNQISKYVNHYTNLVISLESAFDKELMFLVTDFDVIKRIYNISSK